MKDSLSATVNAEWERLAAANDWRLVTNAKGFCEEAVKELRSKAIDDPNKIRSLLQAMYFEVLYWSLTRLSDRAAYEFQIYCVQQALKRRVPEDHAEDVGSQTVHDILKSLANVKNPRTFLKYVLTANLRNCIHFLDKQKETLVLEDSIDVPDKSNLENEIDFKDLLQRLEALINTHIQNSDQRDILVRLLIRNDHPRDIAHDLKIPLAKIHTAKHRSIERLKKESAFLVLLDSLRN